MAKNTKTKKRNAKRLATQILVFVLAAMFILTTFVSIIPAIIQ